MSVVAAVILVVITVMQGGFYSNSYLLMGLALAFLLLVRGRMRVNRIVFFSFTGIFVLYLVSGIAHSFTALQYLPVYKVLCCLVFYIFISSFSSKERENLWKGIVVAGVITACLGLICYTTNLPIPAAVDNGRLQSTLQYANAAAILFVLALMAMKGTEGKTRFFRPLVLIALLLTLSFGGMLAYCLAVVLFACRQKRGERLIPILYEIVDFSIAAIFAAGIYYFQNTEKSMLLALLLLALLCCLCPVWKRITDYIVNRIAFRILSIALLCVECAGILLLRGTEAMGTFANRLTLIGYGLNALAANPVLGIGPGEWAHKRGMYEPVYDRANIIHSSYIQIAVDAGVFALILIVVIAAAVLWMQKKSGKPWKLSALAALLFHGLIDVTFCFTGIVFCGIAVSVEEEKQGFVLPAWAVRLIAGGAFAAFLIIDIIYF